MSALHHPLHVAAVGIHNVRYFESPLDGPRQPWHCANDLFLALAMPSHVRRGFLKDLRSKWKKDTRVIDVADGVVTICPHYMAQGFIHAALELGKASRSMLDSYTQGLADAMDKICAARGLFDGEAADYGVAALCNEHGWEKPWPRAHQIVGVRYPDGTMGFDWKPGERPCPHAPWLET